MSNGARDSLTHSLTGRTPSYRKSSNTLRGGGGGLRGYLISGPLEERRELIREEGLFKII